MPRQPRPPARPGAPHHRPSVARSTRAIRPPGAIQAARAPGLAPHVRAVLQPRPDPAHAAARPRAAHVQAALQLRPDPASAAARPLAAHVKRALGAVQIKAVQPFAAPLPLPHRVVQRSTEDYDPRDLEDYVAEAHGEFDPDPDDDDDLPGHPEEMFPDVLYDLNYAAGGEGTFGNDESDLLDYFDDTLRAHVFSEIVAAGAANIVAATTYKRHNHDAGLNPVGSGKDIMRVVLVDINNVPASNFDSHYTYRLRIRARVVFDIHYTRAAGGGNDIAGRTAGSVWIRRMHYNPGLNTPLAVVNASAEPWGSLVNWQLLPASNTIP